MRGTIVCVGKRTRVQGSTPCMDDHQFKEINWKQLETCRKSARKFSWHVFIEHASEGRTCCAQWIIKKWNRSCDERLARLISYIHFTTEGRRCCHVGNIALACRLGLFQDADLASHLKSSKSTSGGSLCIFKSHAFVPVSCSCRKQTAVLHSSTEAEIISLDAGLRLERSPSLNLSTW